MISALPGILEQQGLGAASYKLAGDGVSRYLSLPTDSFNGVRGISTWVYLKSTPSSLDTFANRNITASNANRLFMYFDASGKLVCSNYDGAGSNANRVAATDSAIPENQWVHIYYNIDSVTGSSFYINGVKQSSGGSDTNAITSANGTVSMLCDDYFNIRYVDADIKEIKFFTTALTQEEIISEMTYHPTGLEVGLKEYYNLTEGSGTSTTGIKGNIATLSTASMWEETPYTDYNHIKFTSSNQDSIDLGTSILNSVRTISLTYTPVVDINSGSATFYLISKYNAGAGNEVLLYNVAGRFYFVIRNGGFTYVQSNTDSWTSGVEYNLTFVMDGVTGMKMYVDGVAQTFTNASTLDTGVLSVSTDIGGLAATSAAYSDCSVKNIKVWTTARTPAEVISDMTSIPDGTETGLKAYFPFLQLEGNKIYDHKDNYSGTISSSGTIDDMWELTDPTLQLNNRELHYNPKDSNSYSGTGTTLYDLSGNARNATLITPTFNATTKGLVFNGTSDYINTGYSYPLAAAEATDFTVVTMFNNTTSTDASALMFSHHNGTPIPFYALVSKATGLASCYTRGTGGGSTNISSTTLVNDGVDHVLVYRKRGSEYSLFIDGVLEATNTASVGATTATTSLVLGRLSISLNQSKFQGEEYGFLLYSSALTNKEIVDTTNNLLNG